MIQSLGHAALTVEDMAASLKYYCDVLGCEKAFEIHKEDGTPWIVYVKVSDGRFIELFYGGEVKTLAVENKIGFNHLCFEVDNVQKVADLLVERGAPLDVAPKQGRDSNWQCWSHDPDGNRIEFMQLNADSPQAAARAKL